MAIFQDDLDKPVSIWILLELRLTEVTNRAIRHAKLTTTNKPTHNFLQARCLSFLFPSSALTLLAIKTDRERDAFPVAQTKSVRAQKGTKYHYHSPWTCSVKIQFTSTLHTCSSIDPLASSRIRSRVPKNMKVLILISTT